MTVARGDRGAWTTEYPFESPNGGLGTRLACGAASVSGALLGLPSGDQKPGIMVLTNPDVVTIYVAWGAAGVAATTSSYPLLPGTKEVITLPLDGSVTNFAGITDGASAVLLAHTGFGNV